MLRLGIDEAVMDGEVGIDAALLKIFTVIPRID